MKTWTSAMKSPASLSVYGGTLEKFVPENMNSKTAGMWVSLGGMPGHLGIERGVKIVFEEIVTITSFRLTPRKSRCTGCEDRYRGVELVIDESSEPAAKTPHGPTKAFKAFEEFDVLKYRKNNISTGRQFKLDWSNAPEDHPVQIEWIEIDYFEPAKGSKTWNTGMQGLGASFTTYGGSYDDRTDKYKPEKLQQREGMWHSKAGSGAHKGEARGITIYFEKTVTLTRFEITPRSDGCWDCAERYRGVALLVDENRIPQAKTPSTFEARRNFDMMDDKHRWGDGKFTGKVFKLDWFDSPADDPAQIEFIEIDYTEPEKTKAVSVWSLNCPAGYTGLGHVATIEYNMTMPGDVYCMKSDFVAPVETADWTPAYSHRFRFTDKKSGKTVERWNIINKSIRNDECQNLFTFTAASRDYPQGGSGIESPYFEQLDKNYCLTKNMANYRTEKPVNNIYMTDVEYDFENVDKETKPAIVHLTTMLNEGDFPQTATRTINTATSRSMSYHTAESTSYGGSFGVSVPLNPGAGKVVNLGRKASLLLN